MSYGNNLVTCPACGAQDLNLCKFDSMMVLKADFALFTLRCPHCGTSVSAAHCIPPQLYDEVRYAAIEAGAGMGQC